jgi:hypothetical protein
MPLLPLTPKSTAEVTRQRGAAPDWWMFRLSTTKCHFWTARSAATVRRTWSTVFLRAVAAQEGEMTGRSPRQS